MSLSSAARERSCLQRRAATLTIATESRDAPLSSLRRMSVTSLPERISHWTAFLCAALAPLAFGATQFLPVVVIIAGLSLTLAYGVWTAPRGSAICIGVTAFLTALFPVVYALQISVGPVSEPLTVLTEMARKTLAGQGRPSLSVSLYRDPFEALAAPLLCGLAVSCGLLIGATVQAAQAFQNRFAWFSAIYTTTAFSLYLAAPRQVLWFTKRAHEADFTATFLNRNTAATFIGMGLICMVGVLMRAIRQRGQVLAGRLPATFQLKRNLSLAAIAIVVLLIGLLSTDSRSGIALSAGAAALPFLLRMLGGGRGQKVRSTTAFVALGVLIVFPVVIGLLDLRISSRLTEGGGRLDAYRATLNMIADNPLLGVGLGNFVETFPLWRLPGSGWGVWDRAHNVWLELAAEAGLPLALLIGCVWLGIGVILALSAFQSRRLVTAVPFAVYLLGTSHSLIDFSIQIPGCGVAFYMFVGCGLALALRRDAGLKMQSMDRPTASASRRS